jgi:hypothetical protein
MSKADQNYRAFRDQLLHSLAPLFNDYLYSLYLTANNYAERNRTDALLTMQKILAGCAQFKEQSIAPLTTDVEQKVPWMRQIIRQMIIQQIFLLMSRRYDKTTPTIDVDFELPGNTVLIHKLLCGVCHWMQRYVSLYDHNVPEMKRTANAMQAEEEIRIALKRAFLTLVPIQKIVETHLTQKQQEPPEAAHEPDPVAELLESEKPADPTALPPDLPQVSMNIQEKAKAPFSLDDLPYDDIES